MKKYLEVERRDINSMPISELDNQIMSGTRSAVYINDGCIIGDEG